MTRVVDQSFAERLALAERLAVLGGYRVTVRDGRIYKVVTCRFCWRDDLLSFGAVLAVVTAACVFCQGKGPCVVCRPVRAIPRRSDSVTGAKAGENAELAREVLTQVRTGGVWQLGAGPKRARRIA